MLCLCAGEDPQVTSPRTRTRERGIPVCFGPRGPRDTRVTPGYTPTELRGPLAGDGTRSALEGVFFFASPGALKIRNQLYTRGYHFDKGLGAHRLNPQGARSSSD